MSPAAGFPILFITATRIGDAVLSSGLIKRLSDEIPNARFTIVAGPDAAPLFAHVPNLVTIRGDRYRAALAEQDAESLIGGAAPVWSAE